MSCTGFLGFLCTHVALLLFITGLFGNAWIIGNTTDTSDMTNATCSKGLWYSNCGKPSSSIFNDHFQVERYFRASQALYSVAAVTCLAAILFTYISLCFKPCFNSICCNGFLTALEGVSLIAAASALIMVAVSFQHENTFPPEYKYLNLGWTYWVAVASGGMIFFATMFTGCNARNNVNMVKSANSRSRQTYDRI